MYIACCSADVQIVICLCVAWNRASNGVRKAPSGREPLTCTVRFSLPFIQSDKLQFLVLLNESNSVLNMRFYRITAPKGIRESFAILKHCSPTGMPTMVMQQIRPQTR